MILVDQYFTDLHFGLMHLLLAGWVSCVDLKASPSLYGSLVKCSADAPASSEEAEVCRGESSSETLGRLFWT